VASIIATVAGRALAWGGLIIPVLRPLYAHAWSVGFAVAGGVYLVLSDRRRQPSAKRSS